MAWGLTEHRGNCTLFTAKWISPGCLKVRVEFYSKFMLTKWIPVRDVVKLPQFGDRVDSSMTQTKRPAVRWFQTYVAYVITADIYSSICDLYRLYATRSSQKKKKKKNHKMDHSAETVYVHMFHAWNYQVKLDVLEFRGYRNKPVTIYVSPVQPLCQRGVIVECT